MTLSDTQTSILRKAAQHSERLVVAPAHLPPGPRVSIARALLNTGLVARAKPSDGDASWKLDGEVIWLSITDAGRRAIGEASEDLAPASGVEPVTTIEASVAADSTTLPAEARVAPPTAQHRPTLREAATALLACLETTTEREPLADAVVALKTALRPTRLQAGSASEPRVDTKHQAVLALLRRPEGATIANVVEATGWAQHTVRGFFAGLKKKGHTVEVLDRVRQNGPGNAGAKGSYSIYRMAEAS